MFNGFVMFEFTLTLSELSLLYASVWVVHKGDSSEIYKVERKQQIFSSE